MAGSIEEHFEELADLGREDYGSYLFVKHGASDGILQQYGIDPTNLEIKKIADLFWSEQGPRVFVSVMPTGDSDWVAFGEHGVDLIGRRILESVSRGTTALLLGFTTGFPRIRIAVDGSLVRTISPTESGYDPTVALEEETGLGFGSAGGQVGTFLFIERMTGLRMTKQWMLGPNPTASVS